MNNVIDWIFGKTDKYKLSEEGIRKIYNISSQEEDIIDDGSNAIVMFGN